MRNLSRIYEDKGLVSIIIPAYNAEKWIKRSVYSALRQTYQNVEVIVVENGSTDNTMRVLQTISDIKLHIHQSERGVSYARNKGMEKAKGQYLVFLDADDWLKENAIEKLIVAVDDSVDIVSARYVNDKPFEQYTIRKYEKKMEEYILKCLYTPTKRGNSTGNLYRSSFVKESGVRFDPTLSHAEDSVFFISLLMKCPVVVDLEEPIYYVYTNPDSATRKGLKANEFYKPIHEIYHLLEAQNEQIQNAGHIFALNQLLIILVHSDVSIGGIRTVCDSPIFKSAIRNANISHVSFGKRIVFRFLKLQLYTLVFIVVLARRKQSGYLQRKRVFSKN